MIDKLKTNRSIAADMSTAAPLTRLEAKDDAPK